jgi:hypothetical protein
MRCFFLALFLALPSIAIAAAAESGPSASRSSLPIPACGATVADALRRAQLSLDAGTAQSQRAAVQCLIEAVSALREQNPVAKRADGGFVLTAPSDPFTQKAPPK